MSNLKEFAIFYVNEHDRLTKEEKSTFYKFIKEGTEDQVKYLLETGKMTENLTELYSTKQINFLDVVKNTEFRGGDPIDSAFRYIYNQGHNAGRQQGWRWGYDVGNEIGRSEGVGLAVGTAAMIASILFVSYKLYTRFLSKATRSCKGKSGVEKTSCINKFRREAQKERVKYLEQSIKHCSKTKNPEKCKTKVNQKIRKQKAKLGELN